MEIIAEIPGALMFGVLLSFMAHLATTAIRAPFVAGRFLIRRIVG